MDTGTETALGIEAGVAVGLGFVVFPVVDCLKRSKGKVGTDVDRLALIVALALSSLVTLIKVGNGNVTGWVIVAAVARTIVTAAVAIAIGKGRQKIPDNRPELPCDEPEPAAPTQMEGFVPRAVKEPSENE